MFNFISDHCSSCILTSFIRHHISLIPPLLFIQSYYFIKISPCTFILPSCLSTHPHCAQDTTFGPSVLYTEHCCRTVQPPYQEILKTSFVAFPVYLQVLRNLYFINPKGPNAIQKIHPSTKFCA